jgi:peptide chain release factor 2
MKALKRELPNCGGHFDSDAKEQRIKELETIMNDPNFWNDKKKSESLINELNNLKKVIENTKKILNEVKSNLEIINNLKDNYDADIKDIVESDVDVLTTKINELEMTLLLNGPYDACNCLLEIHPGAGGTESCDWAMMLMRMYLRYCEKHNFKTEIIDYQEGEEAGIKSVSIIINGLNAYGYLKWEKGVHRLIRISPFDSNKRRHTSFASIDITPIFNDEDVDININENDIRVDVYRSSGKGGQGVNTTDSAVRITHLETGIVVTCQNERSQIRNKETCMKVLKNKLYQLEIEKKALELSNIKGENKEINFGSQIRTYTLHPYTLVKDHRTNTSYVNALKVLDGDIDLFIYDNLKRGVKDVF